MLQLHPAARGKCWPWLAETSCIQSVLVLKKWRVLPKFSSAFWFPQWPLPSILPTIYLETQLMWPSFGRR
jgi:hypothetical protein